MSRIISIGTAVPRFKAKQNDILDFMCSAYNNETASRLLKILFRSSGIETRYSVLPDFGKHPANNGFFTNGNRPEIESRMKIYRQNATNLAIDAINESCRKINVGVQQIGITHLIAVSCTGLYIPGIDTEVIERLGLEKDIFRTPVNFSGCYAALPALRIADMIARTDKNAKVLVVCVELCTLHFQPKNDHDNLLSNTIFGDGAAAVLVVSDNVAKGQNFSGLDFNGFYSALLSEGKNLMEWNIKSLNFEMVLNAKVPEFIAGQMDNFIKACKQKLEVVPADIGKWAIHPGGRKILDVVKNNLNFTEKEMKYSYRVLRNYGNMSSPTILFVLNEILDEKLQQDEKVFAIAFGPGMTIETALLSYGK